AATNANLDQMRSEKRFRDDLYYRLSVLEIRLPPLRERKVEIQPLAVQFLKEVAVRQQRPLAKLSEDALPTLMRHDWPGNIRELRNRLERASVLAKGDVLEPTDIFPENLL